MKSRRATLPRIVLLAAALAVAAWSMTSVGQQQGQAPNTEEPDAEVETEREPPPPPSAGEDGTDDVFIPSEEIAADEEVTFPVDI